MNIFLLTGVTEFCGMEKVSINYPMSVGNQGFQITDRSTAYFGLRLSQRMADWRKLWVVLVPELRWRNFCHILADTLNWTFSKRWRAGYETLPSTFRYCLYPLCILTIMLVKQWKLRYLSGLVFFFKLMHIRYEEKNKKKLSAGL